MEDLMKACGFPITAKTELDLNFFNLTQLCLNGFQGWWVFLGWFGIYDALALLREGLLKWGSRQLWKCIMRKALALMARLCLHGILCTIPYNFAWIFLPSAWKARMYFSHPPPDTFLVHFNIYDNLNKLIFFDDFKFSLDLVKIWEKSNI